MVAGLFVLDSDVLITAKNRHYAFDICPGFWESILRRHRDGLVCSIDRVRSELLAGRETDALVRWVKRSLPPTFFRPVDGQKVVTRYSEIMLWVQRSSQHMDSAKAKFASGADGWLAAFASVHGATVVTNEQPAPNAKSAIKLPDVCEQFGVRFRDCFFMLRECSVQFELAETSE